MSCISSLVIGMPAMHKFVYIVEAKRFLIQIKKGTRNKVSINALTSSLLGMSTILPSA